MKSIRPINRVVLLALFFCSVESSLKAQGSGNSAIKAAEKKMSTNKKAAMEPTIEKTKAYIGMWVTADGNVRHELLPGNRYDEARGNRKSAYQGSYKVTGNHIDYKDDTGFTADGEFKDGILYHGGMILHKEK